MADKYDPEEDFDSELFEERCTALEIKIENLYSSLEGNVNHYFRSKVNDDILEKQEEYKVLTGDFYYS